MASESDVERQSVVNSFEDVAAQAYEISETLLWAANALKAVTSGLSQETRDEIFAVIANERGHEEAPTAREDELSMLHELGKAEDLITSLSDSEARIAADSSDNARFVELNGLPPNC